MATYYVKNGGNNSYIGLSDAQAWETIAHVNGFSFNAGDDVYFKCGDTWYTRTDARLIIDWSGTGDTEANRSHIGAYYLDGSETVGVNVDGKPIIDGGWDLSTFESTERRHEQQIRPRGVNYVTIQDVHIVNSHGYAIYNGYDFPSTTGYITYKNILVEDTGNAGLVAYYCGSHVLIEHCKVLRDNRQLFISEASNWGSGIRFSGDYGIARYNEIGNGWGEGIGLGHKSYSYATVENNLVWGRRSVGIYLDAGLKDSTIRNNIVIGTNNTDYHKTFVSGNRTWNAAGIGLNMEIAAGNIYTLRNKIYNNMVIGCNVGIQSINQHELVVGTANRHFVYGNTFIDNYYNIYTHGTQLMDTEYKNNMFVIHDDADAIGCTNTRRDDNVGATNTYRSLGNFWSATPEYSAWEHASDVVGDAKLFKTSGWQNISTPSDIDIAECFAIVADSDAIDSAQDLGDVYDDALMVGCDFNTSDASDADTPIVVVTGDQDDYGSGWDFGAFLYTGTPEEGTPYTRFRGILRQKPQFNQIGSRYR